MPTAVENEKQQEFPPDKPISLILRINLNSGDFSFTKYHLNGFRYHKYIYIIFKDLTDSIHSN